VARHRYRRVAVRAAAGVGLLLTLIALLVFGELRRARAETDALLSDVFNEFLHNVPDLGSGRSFQLVIMREAQSPGTRPGLEPRARWNMLFDEELRFAQTSLITRSSFLLTNAVPTDIRANPRLPKGVESVVLRDSDLDMPPSDFIKRFPDDQSWEIFSISQPGFNFSKTEAILYFDRHGAGLGAGGGYVLLRKVDGVWRIVDEHETWMF
jgi:hypothetical protein